MSQYKVTITVDGDEHIDVVTALSPSDAIRKVSFDFLYDVEFYNPSEEDAASMDDDELRELACEVASDGVKVILRELHNQETTATYTQNDETEYWPLAFGSTIVAELIA
jgi:hypothetical protein